MFIRGLSFNDFRDGVIGGMFLGGSVVMLMWTIGKITGISGIVEGLVISEGQDWDFAYFLGLVVAGYFCSRKYPGKFTPESELSTISLIVAGLFSGFGARLSGGCTSGHGLCGLGRFSLRSLVAVVVFMSLGAITAAYSRSVKYRHLFITKSELLQKPDFKSYLPTICLFLLSWIRIYYLNTQFDKLLCPTTPMKAKPIAFLCGLIFGYGLCISGMTSSEKVLCFLDFRGVKGWDPTLLAVLGSGVMVTSIGLPLLHYYHITTVITQEHLGNVLKIGLVHENLEVSSDLVIGSALFGIGWGLSGICPGPGIVNFGAGKRLACSYVPGLILGILLKDILFPLS